MQYYIKSLVMYIYKFEMLSKDEWEHPFRKRREFPPNGLTHGALPAAIRPSNIFCEL
jgi:hypothetical protein